MNRIVCQEWPRDVSSSHVTFLQYLFVGPIPFHPPVVRLHTLFIAVDD